LTVYEDACFLVEQGSAPPMPGYLILHLKAGQLSLGDLDPDTAARLGMLLARATRAIETAVQPERVYCLVFAEVKREVHFHLFPRSRWLLEAYWAATGTAQEPVDGPKLFQWTRATWGQSACLPRDLPELRSVCQQLSRELHAPALTAGQPG
jgi:diadenosine tetraphosphate (Ap4A) HIT family hydrolase